MNWLDIIILVILVSATFTGLKTGIIKAVLSLAGLIIGVILAGRYYVPLAGQLTFISQENVAKIVAFALILVGMMIIAGVLANLLKWAVSMVMLGWVNRLGGAAFGLLMGTTFGGALLAVWIKFLGFTSAIGESALAKVLLDYFPIILALLPEEFDAVRSFFQ